MEVIGGYGFGIGYLVLIVLLVVGCVELIIVGLEIVMIVNGCVYDVFVVCVVSVVIIVVMVVFFILWLGLFGMVLVVFIGLISVGLMLMVCFFWVIVC